LVEGTLIISDRANATLDAHYIMIKGGTLQIGTESAPYTGNLVITLHGEKDDERMPMYGNKVLAIREGTLDMHGAPRIHTWVNLTETAAATL
jgi:hypothetical protein